MKKELAIIQILVYNVCGESPKRTKPNQPNEHDQEKPPQNLHLLPQPWMSVLCRA